MKIALIVLVCLALLAGSVSSLGAMLRANDRRGQIKQWHDKLDIGAIRLKTFGPVAVRAQHVLTKFYQIHVLVLGRDGQSVQVEEHGVMDYSATDAPHEGESLDVAFNRISRQVESRLDSDATLDPNRYGEAPPTFWQQLFGKRK